MARQRRAAAAAQNAAGSNHLPKGVALTEEHRGQNPALLLAEGVAERSGVTRARVGLAVARGVARGDAGRPTAAHP
jgi:hypothetical protein